METTYKSKVDRWLAVLVYGLTLLSYAPAVIGTPNVMANVLMVLTLAFEALTIHGFRYVVSDSTLTVVSMLTFRSQYRIMDITRIRRTHTALSSPGASFDRIELRIGRQSVVISPKRRDAFIAQLVSINPAIVVEA